MLVSDPASSLDGTAHIIQVALTPVFLLSGIATLLNVFGTRLARVADQVEALAARIETTQGFERARLAHRLARLRLRSLLLDAAVILGAVGGIAVCGAVLTLFVGALRDATVASLLFGLFGSAILCTLGALAAFGIELLIASRGVRMRIEAQRSEIEEAGRG